MTENEKPLFEINELADSELEEIAKTKVEIEDDDHGINDAHKFIMHFNVKAGDTRVPSFMVYQTYKKWKIKNSLEPQHKNMFLKDFAKMSFKAKKDPYFKYYLLDPAPFDLSEAAFEEHRREQDIETEKRYQAKKKADKYKKIVEKQKAEEENS